MIVKLLNAYIWCGANAPSRLAAAARMRCALAILFTTAHGMVIQVKGLRKKVDPHYRRGLSYLKIGIRWLKGVLHKGRHLFDPQPLFSQDIQPCFASKKDRREYYDAIWFTRISEVKCLNI